MQKRPSFSATKEEICDVQSEPIVQKLFEDAIEVLRLAGAYEKDTGKLTTRLWLLGYSIPLPPPPPQKKIRLPSFLLSKSLKFASEGFKILFAFFLKKILRQGLYLRLPSIGGSVVFFFGMPHFFPHPYFIEDLGNLQREGSVFKGCFWGGTMSVSQIF